VPSARRLLDGLRELGESLPRSPLTGSREVAILVVAARERGTPLNGLEPPLCQRSICFRADARPSCHRAARLGSGPGDSSAGTPTVRGVRGTGGVGVGLPRARKRVADRPRSLRPQPDHGRRARMAARPTARPPSSAIGARGGRINCRPSKSSLELLLCSSPTWTWLGGCTATLDERSSRRLQSLARSFGRVLYLREVDRTSVQRPTPSPRRQLAQGAVLLSRSGVPLG
jgi:hypothetical protein